MSRVQSPEVVQMSGVRKSGSPEVVPKVRRPGDTYDDMLAVNFRTSGLPDFRTS